MWSGARKATYTSPTQAFLALPSEDPMFPTNNVVVMAIGKLGDIATGSKVITDADGKGMEREVFDIKTVKAGS